MKNPTLSIAGLLCLLCFVQIATAQNWTLLNPSPTFNALHAASFPSPDTGFITGNNSTVLRTFDRGETWTKLAFPAEGVPLTSVNFRNNNQGTIVSWSHILTTSDAGETWQYTHRQLMGDYTNSFFLNDTLGWVVGTYRIVMKTTDGGQNWELLSNSIAGAFDYRAIAFANPDTGYLVGYHMGSPDIPVIRRSDDGGLSWYDIAIPEGIQSIEDVSVLGPNDVWFGAGNPMVNNDSTMVVFKAYHTVDGGLSWTTHEVGQTDGSHIRRVHFFNPLEGRLMAYSKIYGTSDGGQSWTIYPTNTLFGNALTDFSWSDMNHCVAVGWGPTINFSNDGGLSWESRIQGPTDLLRCVYFLDENNGFAGGTGDFGTSLHKTADGGETWTSINLDTIGAGQQIWSLAFSSAENGWATTYGNRLYHTTDGGNSWHSQLTDISNLIYISTPDEYTIFLESPLVSVMKSTDGGTSWSDASPSAEAGMHAQGGMVFTDALTGYLGVGYGGNTGKLLKTVDGGNSWQELNIGFPYEIQSMSFTGNNHGVISIQGIGFLTTNDGGESWSGPVKVGAHNFSYLKMLNEQKGMAVLGDQLLVGTNDGWQNWEVTFEGPGIGSGLQSMFFIDERLGWSVGNSGIIMRFDGFYTDVPQVADDTQPADGWLYPNPAGDRINLREMNIDRLRMYQADGRLVLDLKQSRTASIDISSLPAGLYLVVAEQGSLTFIQKLVKQ